MLLPLILLVDNYDSFTYNLYDYIVQSGETCQVIRNDEAKLLQLDIRQYQGVVLSPGPGRPEQAGDMMAFIAKHHLSIPMLGVCLGHQALGIYFGVKLVKAVQPMHGKLSLLKFEPDAIFSQCDLEAEVVRYHSLLLEFLPKDFKLLASSNTGEIMAMKHKYLPLYGLQYHPEAALTKDGLRVINNWVKMLEKK